MNKQSASPAATHLACPDHDCDRCPRLKAFRDKNRRSFPSEFNGPVPSFGPMDAQLLIVGLAPGLRGANFTGRPFTGDYAGDLLYATLIDYGFARGVYQERADDGLTLHNCRITNAVRCVPPENKPIGEEVNQCQVYLKDEIEGLKNLKLILSLGTVSHNAVLRALGERIASHKFAHGAKHSLQNGLTLIDSYHCSRYNTNTGRLTESMFKGVFGQIKNHLAKA
jgi:uracil-DNA glycosylase